MDWIKVEDRLPEFDTPVLVYAATGWSNPPAIFIATFGDAYTRGFEWRADTSQIGGYDYEVESGFTPTHWQPLPERPSE